MSMKYLTQLPLLMQNKTPTTFLLLSSCYENDSIKGIYNTLADCAAISKWAGGIGLHIRNVRGIRGTNGTSNGIVPSSYSIIQTLC